MNRLDVMIKIGRFAFYMTMSFAAIALTVSIVQTNYQVGLLLGRANTASEQLFECKGNAACLQSQILATVGYPDWHSALAALRERYATMPLAVAEALVDRAHLEHLEESFTSAPLDLGKKI